jgi:tetratricopeptide (TPR) repeat protein
VLTLRGGQNGATVGLQSGQIHLLPEPDEDPEIWRRRSERAWVNDPNERIDALRMTEIAYAVRLEAMFQLLDSEGVHFRFEPGPLPDPNQPLPDLIEGEDGLGRMETGGPKLKVRMPVHCPGVSVEFLLLEYARLSDEGQSYAGPPILVHEVPRAMGPEPPSPEFQRFWEECDGTSNLVEISDRLGWPLRQCRATLQDLFGRGLVRLADAREMLVLAQKELAENRFARAASRLAGWVSKSPAGPPPAGDTNLLLSEWSKGKLPAMIASMPPREARTLLKRLEMAEGNIPAAVERWRKMREHHRHDQIAELRQIKWQLASSEAGDAPDIADLLRIARKFQDLGLNARAGVLLRSAAALDPESTSMRLELGQRMLAVELVGEGGQWITAACRTLIESGLSEKAVGPLRSLTTVDPANREARALLNVARKQTLSGKRLRRNTLVGLAGLGAISLAAMVKLQLDQDVERRLDQVTSLMDQPQQALGLLEQEFGVRGSPAVERIREELTERVVADETQVRQAWLDRYREAELECTLGDPLLGLERALALPDPPRLNPLMGEPEWPLVETLLDGLAGRLEQTVAEWSSAEAADARDLNTEERLGKLVDDLRELSDGAGGQRDLNGFRARLGVLDGTLERRAELRAEERKRVAAEQRLERQNVLLATARAHAQAGDLERAVRTFDELVSIEGSEFLARALAPEVNQVQAHFDAVQQAIELSERGEHGQALIALEGRCPDPSEHLMPWRVETWPTGARVTLTDGWVRVAPFTMHSAFGEPVELSVQLEGHEPLTYRVEQPRDIKLHLSRRANRAWPTEHPVTAIPVAVDQDHVCANRAGEIVRLGQDGLTWRTSVESLAGIARTLVRLPRQPSSLLAVTEEGTAWIVGAADGALQGQWKGDSPPLRGPHAGAAEVAVTLRDLRQVRFRDGIVPEVAEITNLADPAREDDLGDDAGMVVLRRRAEQGLSVASSWTPFSAVVFDDHYKIFWSGRSEPVFTVRRNGDWYFLCWEAPDARIPGGRLWISDDAGLRAFEP